jgi:hypothetical protein
LADFEPLSGANDVEPGFRLDLLDEEDDDDDLVDDDDFVDEDDLTEADDRTDGGSGGGKSFLFVDAAAAAGPDVS